jgi:hypothetical protein
MTAPQTTDWTTKHFVLVNSITQEMRELTVDEIALHVVIPDNADGQPWLTPGAYPSEYSLSVGDVLPKGVTPAPVDRRSPTGADGTSTSPTPQTVGTTDPGRIPVDVPVIVVQRPDPLLGVASTTASIDHSAPVSVVTIAIDQSLWQRAEHEVTRECRLIWAEIEKVLHIHAKAVKAGG